MIIFRVMLRHVYRGVWLLSAGGRRVVARGIRRVTRVTNRAVRTYRLQCRNAFVNRAKKQKKRPSETLLPCGGGGPFASRSRRRVRERRQLARRRATPARPAPRGD